MTKLYHNGALWQVPGRQDKAAERIDVPGPPDALAAWLNDRRVMPEGSELAGIVPVNAAADELLEEIRPPAIDTAALRNRCPECKALVIATPEGADKAAIGRSITRISDWLDTAPDWAINRLSELMLEKADDHRNRGRVN